MKSNISSGWRKALAGLTAVTLAVGPVIQAANAATTELSDLPIAAKVTAKPNILYTLDDSGSMNLNYLPGYVVDAAAAAVGITKITRVGTTATVQVSTTPLTAGMTITIQGANQAAYNGVIQILTIVDPTHFTYTVAGAPATPATGAISYFIGEGYCRSGIGTLACNGPASPWNYPPFNDSDFNHLSYNPNVTYTAPIKYDGTSYPDQNAATTTNWTKVQSDPYLTPATKVSLIPAVAVPVYCDSDWPLTTTVGNANGEYLAGSGADCRINGTQYDAAGSTSAPAVVADYNYPWQPTVAPSGAQYFYAATAVGGTSNHGAGAAKTLWCNTASAGWPTNPNITGCIGGTITYNTAPQTCNAPVAQCNPTLGLRNYTPAACKTGPFDDYCAPNTGGSDGNSLGTGTVPECAACTCKSDYTPPSGKCSSTGATCSSAYGVSGGDPSECPPQNTTINNCGAGTPVHAACTSGNAPCVCGGLLNGQSAGGTTLQNDADLVNGGTGATCRHNNQDYSSVGGPTSSPVNYSTLPLDANFKTQVTSGCPALPNTVNIPRHYYTVPSVQFCNASDTVNNDQLKGFGTGVCQAKNDFVSYINVSYGQFTRVDLVNDGRTFAYTDPYTGLASTRTYAQEMTNYSNWYAYYRTRVLAAKTTTAIAFSFLDATYRVGFHTLNTPGTNWVNINDWTPGVGGQRQTWYNTLFGVTIPNAQTPSLDVLLRVGELFRTGQGGAGSLPAMPEGYIPATATDPVTVSCQKNYSIYFTDGFTNQPTEPASWPYAGYATGEVDGAAVPVFPPDPDPINEPQVTVAGLRALTGSAWPNPYLDPNPTPGTLADIALYYYMTDLRPAGLWPPNISTTNVPSNDGRAGADLVWTNDPAFWQHVNFSAISFGSEGLLDASNAVNVTNNIASGAQTWFTVPNLPSPPNNPKFPPANKGATAVDDLWHATTNARGDFVYAKDPLQVSYGLGHILAGIQNQEKARAGSAFSSEVLTATNHSIFEPTIEPGWDGDLKKVEIDPTTAVQGVVDWDALSLLNTLLATPVIPPASDSLYPWFASRRVVTWNPTSSSAVPFLYANLTAAQLATLAGTAAIQQNMIAYLRGGSVAGAPTPSPIEGTSIGQFRSRFGKLGDISDSKPLVVNPPSSPWSDSTDPGYSAFVAANAARATRVYVGANDGMLHAFDAATGDEDFAFIPAALFTNAVDQDGAPRGIQALAFQDGGAPPFKHHFYVDGSPRSSDVDFGNTGGSVGAPDWHSIVVGGLGKGGNSIYAIDATIPVNTGDTEASVASKVLWEFTDPDMQYSFSAPIIGKTRADGWVVIVANGYDAPSGKGKLYVINAKTGALIRTLTTTGADPGNAGSPSGLAQISGFTQDFHNQIIEQVYGGDLNGNVWRWDISDPTPGNWQTVLFAQLTDPSGVVQPVTTAPQIEIDLNNGTDRWVFVGTGRLLHTDDLTIPTPEQIETMYAIRDGSLSTPSTAGLPIQPRATLAAADPLTTGPIAGPVPNGWYMDLPLGQRIVTNPEADLNVVAFIGTEAPNDPCLTALPAYVYAREFTSAESDIQDSGGVTVASAYSAQGAVDLALVSLVNPGTSFPSLAIAITQETNAAITPFTLQPKSFGGGHRMSWRLLGD